MLFSRMGALVAVIAAALFAGDQVRAQSVESFYRGRDVKIIIPAAMGGSFGLYGQLAAKHLQKHLPGQPNLVAQAMPGAGGVTALMYVYNAAPKDGSVLMIPHTSMIFESIFNPKAKFEADKFQYIGRLAESGTVGMVHKRTGIKSTAEAIKKPLNFGATGSTNALGLSPIMFNRMAGAKIKVIIGYPGAAEINLAVERGELDGMAVTVVNPDYLEFAKKLKAKEPTDLVPIFTTSRTRIPELPNVPTITEFKGTDSDRRFYDVVFSDALIGRSLAFPPGVPTAYVEAFRKGFDAMLKDPEFLDATVGRGIPLHPMRGAELAKLISEIARSVPADKREEVNKTYKEVQLAFEKK